MQGSLGGGILSAAGTIFGGIAQKNSADLEAEQARIEAGETMAASEGRAEIVRKKTQLVQSSARAAAGASGAGVSDTTVQDLQAETGRTGEYDALSALFTGKAEAASLRTQASLDEFAGNNALISSIIKGTGDILGSTSPDGSGSTIGQEGMSMFEKYAMAIG